VLSATVFGAMGGSDSDALMAAYMDYLILGTGIDEGRARAAVDAVSLSPSVARAGQSVRFLTSGPGRSLAVLDAAGRTLARWQLGAGPVTTTWNVGRSVAPGAYFLQVRGGHTETRPFTIVR
jgi:hypothetical protein